MFCSNRPKLINNKKYCGLKLQIKDDINVACGIISMEGCSSRRDRMLQNGVPREWVANYFKASDLRRACVDHISSLVNLEAFQRNYGRHPSRGEVGCAVSHKLFYYELVKSGLPLALVFEDDLLPLPDMIPSLSRLATDLNTLAMHDYSFICNIGLPEGFIYTHKLKRVLIREHRTRRKTEFLQVCNAADEIWRANAYFISSKAAKAILECEPLVFRLADDWSGRKVDGSVGHIFVTAKALATQDTASKSTIEEERRDRAEEAVADQELPSSGRWTIPLYRVRALLNRARTVVFEVRNSAPS